MKHIVAHVYKHTHSAVCLCRCTPSTRSVCCISCNPQAFQVGHAGQLFTHVQKRNQNLPGPEGIVSPANCDLLDGVQRITDEAWATLGNEIAGPRGKKACQIQAARDSHPEFPIFAAMLGSMPSLGNGHTPPLGVYIVAVCAVRPYSHSIGIVCIYRLHALVAVCPSPCVHTCEWARTIYLRPCEVLS